ncbi:competence protein ComK [Ureibacillus sp. 179-F W5.1 NHS]|uniref:Competence protein n=1 Tax=Lysinibacillus halotolerans TaxID=1368476 RepID=A0A3M8HIP9_9BACI|nr:competence protein ComK [Lysinibacillus halotolerans]RND01804.1 hypothetical protein EC501_01170 [Lysinibacillus halotolerans]
MGLEKEIHFLISSHSSIAVTPHFDGEHSSIIYTNLGSLKSKGTTDEIIRQYCLNFGASLEGRQMASRKLLSITKTPPILISERLGIVGMELPTYNTLGKTWVFDLSFTIEECGAYSLLIFNNGVTIKVALKEAAVRYRREKALHLLYTKVPLHDLNLINFKLHSDKYFTY